MAVNVFGRWLGSEDHLQVDGISGFDQPLSIEHKLKIARRRRGSQPRLRPSSPGVLLGIESKLTETLAEHEPVIWKTPYHAPEMAALLHGGWADVFQSSLSGRWRPAHLGLEQLIKHALALNSHAAGRTAHLAYVYWGPSNGQDVRSPPARGRTAQLEERVGNAVPHLHAVSYAQLLDEWSRISRSPPWLEEHLKQIRDRYDTAL